MSAVWIAVIAISLLGLIFGLILGYASRRFAVQDDPVVEKIDELLPQSQCGQCGYPAAAPMRKRWACRVRKLTAARRVAKR
jgi:electron transport complex protein RnfB